MPPDAGQDATDGARERKQQALDEQLPDNLGAAGPMAARMAISRWCAAGARKQQIRYVRARHEQDQADCSEKSQQRRPHVPDGDVQHAEHPRLLVVAHPFRIGPTELIAERPHASARAAFERCAGLQVRRDRR